MILFSWLEQVGKPIDLPRIESPTQEQIGKYHGQYMDALEDLYHRYSFSNLRLFWDFCKVVLCKISVHCCWRDCAKFSVPFVNIVQMYVHVRIQNLKIVMNRYVVCQANNHVVGINLETGDAHIAVKHIQTRSENMRVLPCVV